MTTAQNILETRNLNKYFTEPVKFHVLKEINLAIHAGEFVSIVGASGSGKSTLLYAISTLDTEFEGDVIINGTPIRNLNKDALAHLRNRFIGFIFQSHYLLSEFTAIENVMLPAMKLKKFPVEEIRKMAHEKLELLGIKEQAEKKVNRLSGGQQQRVAVARALINNPKIIFCDEPTGNLDSKNAGIVFDLLRSLTKQFNQTILMVTHDESFAKATDREIRLVDGKVV